ncbi:MAG: M20 family metallopeptidase [Myxococcales bacterium]|nr:M20 family metallopeptidase [Myxococcales bacterium]
MTQTYPHQETATQILSFLKEHQQDLFALLTRLVQAESPTGSPDDHQDTLTCIQEAFSSIGYQTELLDGPGFGKHLYAHPQGFQQGQPAQLLLGHYDTVWPKGTLSSMPIEEHDGKLTGPGIFDMKAGIVQSIFAIRALQHLHIAPSLDPIALFNSDEERGSRTSTPFIQQLAQQVDRTFVLEPAFGPEGKLKTARKGIGRFTISVKGRAAHAGLAPQEGHSAILELSFVIQKLFALNDFERGITVNVGMIDGGVNTNVIAPESKAVVDVRVLTNQDAAWIEEQIHSITPQNPHVTLEIDGRIGRPPMEKTPANRKLWTLAKLHGSQLGLDLEEVTAGGGSDGNTTSQYTATLDGLGAVGDGAHAPHEYIEKERLLERCALLALLLLAPPLAQIEE